MPRLILILVTLGLSASPLWADPIRFDNPDTPDRFNWGPEEELEEIALDLRAPYWEQPGTVESSANIQQVWNSAGNVTVGALNAYSRSSDGFCTST